MSELKKCLLCDRYSEQVPLIMFEYRGGASWICSEHLPVLIHDPGQLAGRLPGAENLRPSEHED